MPRRREAGNWLIFVAGIADAWLLGMRNYGLVHMLVLYGCSALGGYALGRFAVTNAELVRAKLEAGPPMAMAQRPPRVPASPACALDRRTLLRPSPALLGSARVVPSFVDGRARGFRLYGIARDSLAARVGFRSGDRVLSINGFDPTEPDKAMGLYGQLRDAPRLLVDVERGGRHVMIDCALH